MSMSDEERQDDRREPFRNAKEERLWNDGFRAGAATRLPAWADSLQVATMFHSLYEQLAPSFGYETKPQTRRFDPESPNGQLMIAVCASVLAALAAKERT
jgi:hypothetical protein